MIELINFTKRYGNITAVEDLSLTVPAGEIFGFIGPNGAGKTTTLRFLATLLRASGGEGIVNGYRLSREPLGVRQSIGYMPDGFGLYSGLRVREYLNFFALAHRMPRSRRKAVIERLLARLDLVEKQAARVETLSRGMKQRLTLACALVHDPPVLILDEPASGLDPRGRFELKNLLKQLCAEGKTILVSSHILAELADCCTSVGIIDHGRLVLDGPIAKLQQRLRLDRTVRIKLLENIAAGEAFFRALPATKQISRENNTLRVRLSADDDQLAAMLERLLRSGLRVLSFSEEEPTLEDVFLTATSRPERGE